MDDFDEAVSPLVRPDRLVVYDPGPELLVVAQADLDQGPLDALARLLPQDRGRAALAGLEAGWIAGHDVRPVVPLFLDVDAGRGYAADAGVVGNLAGLDRLQQDGEFAAVGRVFGLDADQRRLILERLEVGRRVDDGADEPQDVEPLAVRAAGVADLDDRAVGIAGVG